MGILLEIISRGFLFFSLHIKNSGAFPQALSSKQENECLKKMKNGSKEARQTLIKHNLRLVAHIVRKYYSLNEDQDDLISIGTIGLIKAVDSFDDSKGIKFATYASRCIENEILMYFRGKKKSAQDLSMNEPIDIDGEGNPLTLMEIISVDDTVPDDIDLKIKTEMLYSFIEKIENPREKEIIVLRYGLYGTEPMTQKEIAKKLDISRSYVSRIEKKTVEDLRKKFKA